MRSPRAVPVVADVRLTLPAQPSSLSLVRQVIGALAHALGAPDEVVHDVRLAVTEACTNVVRHAYRGEDGPLEVAARPHGEVLEVIVSDRGAGMTPSLDRDGPGLGMSLMAALTDWLEIEHAREGGCKLVLGFVLDRDRSAGAEAA